MLIRVLTWILFSKNNRLYLCSVGSWPDEPWGHYAGEKCREFNIKDHIDGVGGHNPDEARGNPNKAGITTMGQGSWKSKYADGGLSHHGLPGENDDGYFGKTGI